jgi:hypothetical protein
MLDMTSAANPFPKNISEDRFKDTVIHIALTYGWRVNHQLPAMNKRGKWMTATQGHIGFPDLVLARDGVVLFRELKSATGRLTPDQKIWGKHLADAWGVWRPTDYEEIVSTLKR